MLHDDWKAGLSREYPRIGLTPRPRSSRCNDCHTVSCGGLHWQCESLYHRWGIDFDPGIHLPVAKYEAASSA